MAVGSAVVACGAGWAPPVEAAGIGRLPGDQGRGAWSTWADGSSRADGGWQVARLIQDGAAWLQLAMTPDGQRLWPSGPAGTGSDPCAVRHGAAGVLVALAAVAPQAGDPAAVQAAMRLACRWIQRRLPAGPQLVPGLYFGHSGTAWALYEAATVLDDPRLAADALDLAARVPVSRISPDVATGLAGSGMVALQLWRAGGQPRFEARVHACAEALVEAAQHTGRRVGWPVPSTGWSTLAGRTHHGYAHGTAGIGAFLLAAGIATSEPAYGRVAMQAAETLAAVAGLRDGAAFWRAGPGSDRRTGASRCDGAAGIGTFLLRSWQATGEPRLLALARAAAVTVHRARGRSDPTACHGAAGGGQYLLDLASALDEPTYRRWAEELATGLARAAVHRHGRWLVPDETGQAVIADYATGLSGVLTFLARLRRGSPPPWTAALTAADRGAALAARTATASG
jgi:lantibiotic modifying enzyme